MRVGAWPRPPLSAAGVADRPSPSLTSLSTNPAMASVFAESPVRGCQAARATQLPVGHLCGPQGWRLGGSGKRVRLDCTALPRALQRRPRSSCGSHPRIGCGGRVRGCKSRMAGDAASHCSTQCNPSRGSSSSAGAPCSGCRRASTHQPRPLASALGCLAAQRGGCASSGAGPPQLAAK